MASYIALVTFPDLKQEVHTCAYLGAPFTIILTLLTFGFQFLFARLLTCERVMLMWRPNSISFEQNSHLAI